MNIRWGLEQKTELTTVGLNSRQFKDWVIIFEEILPDRVLSTCMYLTASLFYSINQCIINQFVNILWVLKRKMNHSNTRVFCT